uniref:phage portal protein n=1 Tax=Alistipes sp. TaxID=1872444 RepID=UPI004056D21E
MGLFSIFSRKKSYNGSALPSVGPSLVYSADELIRIIGAGYGGRIDTGTVEGQSLAFNRASVVDAILFEKVAAMRDARYWLNNDKGEEVDNTAELLRLTTPNNYESFKEFTAKVEFFSQLYGKCYIAKVRAIGLKGEFSLHVLPNLLVKEHRATSGVEAFKPNADIIKYSVTIDGGGQIDLMPEEVEVVSDISYSVGRFSCGTSRLVSLEEQVNNFIAAQQATNELLVNRGMLGIISMKSSGTDAMIAQRLPATSKDKEELERQLSRYGIMRGKSKYAITPYDAAYVPVSSTIADMGISGIRTDCKNDICNAYQVPTVILDVAGSTFSNYGEAKKKMITGDIQPAAQNIASTISRIYGAKGVRLVATFDHLDIFQESKRAQAAGLTSLVNAVRSAVEAGFMSTEQAEQAITKYLTE